MGSLQREKQSSMQNRKSQMKLDLSLHDLDIHDENTIDVFA